MRKISLLLRLVFRLGLANIFRVVLYRVRLFSGWRPRPLDKVFPGGDFFPVDRRIVQYSEPFKVRLFGWFGFEVASCPAWHADPLSPSRVIPADKDWHETLGCLNGVDPKPIWELSRFYWAPQLGLEGRDGKMDSAARLNSWLSNWLSANPPNRGINWACGQEAAIRLMNLALTSVLWGSVRQPSEALKWLVEAHARRIAATFQYAIGQDNNHGSAEACALFVAGTWGSLWGMDDSAELAVLGRRWLNNRALRLIEKDGSPIQYSVTYHRANLETFSFAQFWAGKVGVVGLSGEAQDRVVEGAKWLHSLIDPITGDVPNLGANDGSHLFALSESSYRDFRPTVAFVSAVFDRGLPWLEYDDVRLRAFGIKTEKGTAWSPPMAFNGSGGGFQVAHSGDAMVVLRQPRFKYRPSQSDALHLDFRLFGRNLLRDAGTYCYAGDAESVAYFGGAVGHNTVQFDGRDQMPKISRFLFGDWLDGDVYETVVEEDGSICFGAGYTDSFGARHIRSVRLAKDFLKVTDSLDGSFAKAVLRWRFMPVELEFLSLSAESVRVLVHDGRSTMMTVSSSGPIFRSGLVDGWESRHYLQRTSLQVLEVEVRLPTTLTTELRWNA
ncbi:MAG: heparinase II/III-family protein [Burkholderiaceae bacterium]|nr:heparinase II/III-family protein [Burkholderiaceae bacterium]